MEGRVSLILLVESCFIVTPPFLILEYTGDILGEYFEDFGVKSFLTRGSYNLGLIVLKRLLDIYLNNMKL